METTELRYLMIIYFFLALVKCTKINILLMLYAEEN